MKWCFITSKQYHCVAKALQVNSPTLKTWPSVSIYVYLIQDIGSKSITKLVIFSIYFCIYLSSVISLLFLQFLLLTINTDFLFYKKKYTMQSIRHESRWTLQYLLKYTIKYLYDIYLNINNIFKVIFHHKRKKLEQVFFNWEIVATMWPNDMYKQSK